MKGLKYLSFVLALVMLLNITGIVYACSPGVNVTADPGECTSGGERNVEIEGSFIDVSSGYRGTVYVGADIVWGSTEFTGGMKNVPFSVTDTYSVGSYTGSAVLEKLVSHPAETHTECPIIDWVYGSHHVQVQYEKSSDPNKCHRPSDNDLKNVYGMDNVERLLFKLFYPEWLNSTVIVDKPAWSEWVHVITVPFDFTVKPCYTTCSETVALEPVVTYSDWSPWVWNPATSQQESYRTKTTVTTYVDSRDRTHICDTKTENETEWRYQNADHSVNLSPSSDCEGWSYIVTISDPQNASYEVISGSLSGTFGDNDSNESDVPTVQVTWNDGYSTTLTGTVISFPEDCKPESGNLVIKAVCTDDLKFIKIIAEGEGYVFTIDGIDFPSGGGSKVVENGKYTVRYEIADGYRGENGQEVVGPLNSCWKEPPKPVCQKCEPHQDEIQKSPDDLLIVNYSVGECTVCLDETWGIKYLETHRIVQAPREISVLVSAYPETLDKYGVKYHIETVNGVTLVFLDSEPIVSSLDGLTYYVIDAPKSIDGEIVTGNTWTYYDTATGKPYSEVYGPLSITRSSYTTCSRSIWPIDVVNGNGTRDFGGVTSSEWVSFLTSHGVGGNEAISWSIELWQNGSMSLPALQ